MTTITVSISDELKRKMKKFTFVNWSDVAFNAITNKIKILERMNSLLSNSKMTEEDCMKIGRTIKKREWQTTKSALHFK